MQANNAVLVIDAGTSAMRAVSVDLHGEPVVIASVPWRLFMPEDAAPFGRELDPKEVSAAVDRLAAIAVIGSTRYEAVAVTGQREGLAILDADGNAIFASPNVDARASAEGIAIDAECASDVYETTGHLPSLMQAPAKLAWLRANRPRVAERAAIALPLVDWIAMLLSGRVAMSRSLAAENGFIDVSSGLVATALQRLGVAASCVPEVIDDGAVAGIVSTGPLAGLPVVLGGADTQCALVGMGAVRPGMVGAAAGWSAPLQLVTSAPRIDTERRTWTSVHTVPGAWILESNAGEAGRAWDWICTVTDLTAEQALLLARDAAPGSGDAMAVLGSGAMNAGEMTAGVGMLSMPLPLVMAAPGRGELLRSVLESIAFALRANLEQLERVSGSPLVRLHLGGGMSRSDLFAQIVADVIDRPVAVAHAAETSAVGAAVLAAVTLGLHASLEAAVAAMTRPRRVMEPELAASAAYEDYYERWRRMSRALARADVECA